MTTLFDPIALGSLNLKNRMIMAPLTRGRAGQSRVANDLMAEYYAQRAGAGLIISEATAVCPQGYGWPGAPAMYTDEHVAGWAKTTEAVHKAGGKILLQLWHMGRVSHPDFQGGDKPVGPSAIAAQGEAHTPDGKKPYVEPRPLATAELEDVRADYVRAAEMAIKADFDGVEIHAANGYLLDQFLREGSNKREDDFGGPIENRIRFPLSVVESVADIIGAGKTGVRISPSNPFNDMSDSNPQALFTAFARALNPLSLAYLHIMEPIDEAARFYNPDVYATPVIRESYDGDVVVNGSYDKASGNKALAEGKADAVAYGVPFLATPDLVERYKRGAPINEPDPDTFYTVGAEGYTDYPTLEENEQNAA
jgi:N-ethylmaleimide reductase